MPDRELFSHTFESVETDRWIRAIESEIGADRSIDSLDWTADPGITARPFYRRENCVHAGPVVSSSLRRWMIGDRAIANDNASLERAIEGAIDGGAECLEITGFPIEDAAYFFARGGHADIRVMFRGDADSILSFAHALESLAGTVRADGALLVDPLVGAATDEEWDSRLKALARVLDLSLDGRFQPVALDATALRKQNASLASGIAVLLSKTSELLVGLAERGIAAHEVVRRLTFVWPVGIRFLTEIAAVRALRLLLPQIFDAHLDAASDRGAMTVHAVSDPGSYSRTDPVSNLVRATLQASAAAIGGADSISLMPHDLFSGACEAHEDGRRLARNTLLILRHESFLSRVSEPLAGACAIEAITDELAALAWNRFMEIETAGGFRTAEDRVIDGWPSGGYSGSVGNADVKLEDSPK